MYQRNAGVMAFILLLSAAPASVSADDAMSVYKQSMEKMNSDMQKGMDPDATKAWAKMMIAHHQGGIDMSRALLRETKDPIIRKMAEKTTEEQQREIKQLEEWLSKREK